MDQDAIIINNITGLLVFLTSMVFVGVLLYVFVWPSIDRQIMTKRRRRRAHLRYVKEVITELRFTVLNLALKCERGEISEVDFTKRSLNTAKLLRRYEIKRAQLNRFIG